MSQFKNQTSLLASQGLSLLSPLALKKWQPASSSHICNSECGNDLREIAKQAVEPSYDWKNKRACLLGLAVKLWSVTPHSLKKAVSTAGCITDAHVVNFKNVTLSRRNDAWRRASGWARSNCSHLPWELLSTDLLRQIWALESARSLSSLGKQRGGGGECQTRAGDLYPGHPALTSVLEQRWSHRG